MDSHEGQPSGTAAVLEACIDQPDSTSAHAVGNVSADATTTPQIGILDMPVAWQSQLIGSLGKGTLKLFQGVSKGTRDLVFSLSPMRFEVSLPIPEGDFAALRARLLLLATHSPRIKLCMTRARAKPDARAKPSGPYRHRSSGTSRLTPAGQPSLPTTGQPGPSFRNMNDSASALLHGVMDALGHGLTAVTCVVLTGLELEALVPLWLVDTCPNLTRLVNDGCRVKSLTAPSVAIPICPQLRELELDNTPNMSENAMAYWKHQLRSIPNLSSLSIPQFCVRVSELNGPHVQRLLAQGQDDRFLDCCSAVNAPITHIKFTHRSPPIVQLAAWFPGIVHLESLLKHDDSDMEVLLAMPHLRCLSCAGFSLQKRYSDRSCPWTRIDFTELRVDQLDRLPLETNPVLRRSLCGHQIASIVPSRDAAANARVAAAVVESKGFTWARIVRIENKDEQADTAAIAALMPMLSKSGAISHDGTEWGCAALTFQHLRSVTPELVQAMAEHLANTGIQEVVFERCTHWATEVWPLLLPSLPPSTYHLQIDMYRTELLLESDVTSLCVNADRSLSVEISFNRNRAEELQYQRWEADANGEDDPDMPADLPPVRSWEGAEDCIREAMLDAGHEHVEHVGLYPAQEWSDDESDHDDDYYGTDDDDGYEYEYDMLVNNYQMMMYEELLITGMDEQGLF